MPETVTLKGKSFELKGPLIREGESVPDCELIGADLNTTKLSTFKGKGLVLLSVPSLDTPVCDKEARRFSLELDKCKEWLHGVCVSMDLPFAQSRWCAAEGVKNMTLLSDYKNREFGMKYGVLIPELGLLARAVFIIDANMKLQSLYLVKEISNEPDYTIILERIHQLFGRVGR